MCDPLNFTVQSETWAELMEDIGDTLELMFEDLLNSNELDKFLGEHGWTMAGQIPAYPDRAIKFDVPFIPELMRSSA